MVHGGRVARDREGCRLSLSGGRDESDGFEMNGGFDEQMATATQALVSRLGGAPRLLMTVRKDAGFWRALRTEHDLAAGQQHDGERHTPEKTRSSNHDGPYTYQFCVGLVE